MNNSRIYLNNGWQFVKEFNEELFDKESKLVTEEVRIPHTVAELPFHYFDEHDYQMISGYRKVIKIEKEWEGKQILINFEGVGHECTVYINNKEIYSHHCGYTAFVVNITDCAIFGEDNILVVKVDSRESINVPPFGFVIDYMTYGGIYRDVYMEIKNESYIEDVFVDTRIASEAEKSATISEISLHNAKEGMKLRQYLRQWSDLEEKEYELLEETIVTLDNSEYTLTQTTGEVKLWDVEAPNLYQIKTELLDEKDNVVDINVVRFGYRKAVFHENGFFLNGKKVKIRGLNRHQSYAYTGYAMPESMQKLDADILKNELGCNAARTSHYPQSHYFIDRCDELGILVFTEMPGWQHIGDEDWKNQAVKNTEDMVLQYRNHPSIILWGVRINESVDDDEFYERTNEVAKRLDPSRQTGGVRCYKKGSFLEDVYTYNDFSHTGKNRGCEKKSSVTSDKTKPYLISEYNGHMFPTKAFDWEEKRVEHAIRHANVLEDIAAESDIAGGFGWCMFDYNTHKDFGSGDRICYHGVMDMFRNPKLASYVYACQQEETPVLMLSSLMDIGEHPGCNRGDVYIFTNADTVRMYKNGSFIKEYSQADSKYKHLSHGPIRVDDYIGDTLEKGENMDHKQAEAVKELLNEVARVGLYGLSKKMYIKAGAIVAKYHMSMNDAVALFNKYVGDWGGASTEYTLEGYKDGELVKKVNIKPMTNLQIMANVDHTCLVEKNSYDVASIRITACDENGNVLPFANDAVKLKVSGPIELIGPDIISLQGGMFGTYVKTTGKKGKAKLTIEPVNGVGTEVDFEIV